VVRGKSEAIVYGGSALERNWVAPRATARVDLLDAVRGFALMGIFLVHAVEQFELFWSHPDYGPVFQWVFGLFAGKAYALMALCFGVSFYLIMHSAAQRGDDFRWRFAWRLAILLAIGLVHGLIYRGDFLQTIAITGFLMLPLDRIRSNRILLGLAALCLLQLPLLLRAWAAADGQAWGLANPVYFSDPGAVAMARGTFAELLRANATDGFVVKWSYFIEAGRFMQMLGLFIIGLVLGRIGFFSNPDAFRSGRRWVLAAALVSSVLLYSFAPDVLDKLVAEGAPRNNLRTALDTWTGLAVMTAKMLAFVEIFQSSGQPLARMFAAPGRMTLTLYVGQSIVFTPIFYGYGLALYDDLSLAQCLMIGATSFALQIVIAHLWFRRFHYGPLEWLWRAATRTSLDVPFLRGPAPAIA
jgi:uncharacterized protein